jgi:hypothetical protein
MLSEMCFLQTPGKIFSNKKNARPPAPAGLATLSPQKYFLAFRARDAEDSKL